ncbi:non-homologous end-joining DNA ligase [Ammoniphilus sp. YIM 78166]|uniref:non-homologous end-joining DNA ligase n=1 Tax=Ammoniphilus sp. YIM 78166 TaxID=1644106 RepID=UPI00106FD179|nr:non-homologous end-joining DNA ligase [Ammoniphilus sp. YIM 78166]
MKREEFEIEVEGRKLRITNPQKVLWPEAEVTKLEYIQYLVEIAPYMLSYLSERLLTTIRYPDGIHGKSFYQKNIPDHAPDWVKTQVWRDTQYILANDLPTLVWLGNQACLELHVAFNKAQYERYPTELVFDLDPMDLEDYSHVLEIALLIREVLQALGLSSQAKTSGASGLQIYIPIEEKYTYEETHVLNKFIAQYIAEKYPQKVTIERMVKNRGNKLYFDYIQHGEGRTLPVVYSLRARPAASVSAPVSWEEVQRGFHPTDFTIRNMKERMLKVGDLFITVTNAENKHSLDTLLSFLKQKVT